MLSETKIVLYNIPSRLGAGSRDRLKAVFSHTSLLIQ